MRLTIFAAVWMAVIPAAQSPTVTPRATCLAIPLPTMVGIDTSTTSNATAVRDLFASFLTGPSIKVVKLEARLPSQAALEAQQLGCGLVVHATVTRTRGGGGVARVVGRAAGMAAVRTPLGSGVSGAIASSATSAAGEAIYAVASQTRARDVMELTYRVAAPDSIERATPVSAKAKATTDGEDLLTPLVERAANSIVTTATSERR